jgi:signal transduction histidine kinase
MAAATVMLDRLLHDLKQPLNLIRVVAQDVKRDGRMGRVELDALPGDMDEIVAAVDRLAGEIDRIRTFGSSGADAMVEKEVALGEVCRAVLRRIDTAHPGVEIHQAIQPDLPPAAGDPFHLEQAVWELIDNALRATERTAPLRPEVEVSACQCERGLVIAVRDNGCGVPRELRTKIFDPFFSTYPDRAGLGLTLAAALAADLGGRVELRDAVEAGSVFEICLPMRE